MCCNLLQELFSTLLKGGGEGCIGKVSLMGMDALLME